MHERDAPTLQTIKALDARQHLDKLLGTVFRKEARVVVEKNGHPVAAVVSMDALARIMTLEHEVAGSTPRAPSPAQIDAALAANRAEADRTRALLVPPSSLEIERRRAIAARIRA